MAKMRLDDYGVWVNVRERPKPNIPKILSPRKQHQAEIVERRAAVRRAYFLARSDHNRDQTKLFAQALGGKIDLTDDILNQAYRIIADHQGAVLQ